MRAIGLRTLVLSASIAGAFAPAAIAQVTLRGTVVTEDGEPIKGADVSACYFRYGYGSTCPKTRTDGKGEFSISVPQPPAVSDPRGADERAVDVQARKDRAGYNWTEVRHTDWANPAPTFRLVLRKGGNVRVVVGGVDAARWPQIQVKVTSGGRELQPAAAVPYKQLDIDAYVRSGAKSMEEFLAGVPAAAGFPIRDVPVGEARVEVTLPDGQAFPPQTAKVTTAAETTVHFDARGKGLKVSGRVTDAGVPMKDLVVSFSRPGATEATGVPTGADGAFEIAVEPGAYVVRVMKKSTKEVDGTSFVTYDELGSLERSFSEASTLDLEIGKLTKPQPATPD